jgi:hypothetical protein
MNEDEALTEGTGLTQAAATGLAYSEFDDTDEVIRAPARQVFAVAAAMALFGIAVATVIVATMLGWHSPDTRNDWPAGGGIPPVPASQLPHPDVVVPQDTSPNTVTAALNAAATQLDSTAHDNNTFLALIKKDWVVTDPADAVRWAHTVCNALVSNSRYQVAEEVARQSNTTLDTAENMVASAITVYCPNE